MNLRVRPGELGFQRFAGGTVADDRQARPRYGCQDWLEVVDLLLGGQASDVNQQGIVGMPVRERVTHGGIAKARIETVGIDATFPQPDAIDADVEHLLLDQLRGRERVIRRVEDHPRQHFSDRLDEAEVEVMHQPRHVEVKRGDRRHVEPLRHQHPRHADQHRVDEVGDVRLEGFEFVVGRKRRRTDA